MSVSFFQKLLTGDHGKAHFLIFLLIYFSFTVLVKNVGFHPDRLAIQKYLYYNKYNLWFMGISVLIIEIQRRLL